jgi:hypothetical protein
MNNNQITAEWARKTATSILGEKVEKQLNMCLSYINSAVERNEMSCYVGIYADPLTITELQKRGFKCQTHDDQRDGSSLQINW